LGSGIPIRRVSTLYNQSGRNWKWKIQDGGLDPRNAYISDPRQGSNAFPTVIPMFSGSGIQKNRVFFGVGYFKEKSINTVQPKWKELEKENP